MQKYDEIFKYDTKGKLRVWFMERDGDRYRTVAGIDGGSLVTSEWTQAKVTNEGRSNERSPEEQAEFEVAAAYEKKLTREYHRSAADAKGGAHFFKPMLAKEYNPAKFEAGFAQPKLDGVRCIATKDGLFSRQGKPIVSCPHVEEALLPVFEKDPDFVLDGELYNHGLKDDFNELISLIRKAKVTDAILKETAKMVQYHVYDIPSVEGKFSVRLGACELHLSNLHEAVHIVDTAPAMTAASFNDLHAEWLADGYEGSIWRADAPYEQKRSKHLLKRKDFQDDEFEVVAIEEGQGNWSGLAKRVVCKLPDGREFGAGIRGNMQRAKELLDETHKVVTVRFFAYTPDGIPRFPVVTKFHGERREL